MVVLNVSLPCCKCINSIKILSFLFQRKDHQILKCVLEPPTHPLLAPLPRMLHRPHPSVHLLSACGILLAETPIPLAPRVNHIRALGEREHRQPEVLRHHDITRTAAIRQGDVDGIPARIHEPHRAVIRPQDMMRRTGA